jgi:predicted ATPase
MGKGRRNYSIVKTSSSRLEYCSINFNGYLCRAMHINSIRINPERYPCSEFYPFSLDVFKQRQSLDFNRPVTFFIGENGTGKSTLLRAIALKCSIHIWEHSERTQLKHNPYSNELYKYIDIIFSDGELTGSFFGSEIFRHFAEQLDEWAKMDPAILDYFGGQSLTTKSHGQSNMAFFENRFKKDGLYLLDEPESALSPKSQLELMKIIRRSVKEVNTQFIIATHSPLLLAVPDATILSFDNSAVQELKYENTEYYKVYRDFLSNPTEFLTF